MSSGKHVETLLHPYGRNSRVGTDSKLVADVPVSALQTKTAQLEATIRSAHALLQAGLINEVTSLLAAFSPRN
jgi:hypothetical protein